MDEIYRKYKKNKCLYKQLKSRQSGGMTTLFKQSINGVEEKFKKLEKNLEDYNNFLDTIENKYRQNIPFDKDKTNKQIDKLGNIFINNYNKLKNETSKYIKKIENKQNKENKENKLYELYIKKQYKWFIERYMYEGFWHENEKNATSFLKSWFR